MSIRTVGVVGMGTMGRQIGLVFARGGFRTLMCDRSDAIVAEGVREMHRFLARQQEKGKLSPDAAASVRNRIETTANTAGLAPAEFIVEAVFEDVDTKRSVFRDLDGLCLPQTILATNTSTLSVTEIAAATGRPEKCIGAHFLIPAALTPLVELSRGIATSAETVETAVALLKTCGKETVVVEDSPAFVVNRLYIPFLNEAFYLLQEGVSTAEEIDRACVRGLGQPLGPLAASDASGLDVVLRCVESLHRQLGDKYRPAPMLVKLVKAGRLGRKTGRGVYTYGMASAGRPRQGGE